MGPIGLRRGASAPSSRAGAALLAGLGLAATLLAGCGAESAGREVGTEAADVRAVGSARVETATRVAGGAVGQLEGLRSHAVVDYANGRREDTDAATGCRTITIGDATYTQLPIGHELGTGKRWARQDGGARDTEAAWYEATQRETTSADGRSTIAVLVLVSTPEPPPDEYLAHLRDIGGAVQAVAREFVDGVLTTRYRGAVSVHERTRRELEISGWKPATIDRYVADLVEGTEEVEIWVDAAGRARKVETRISYPEHGLSGGHDSVTTTRFFDFGVETQIQPPPAAEVIDYDEWVRLTRDEFERNVNSLDEQLRTERERATTLPGGFVPPALSGDPEPPPSCLH